METAVKQKEAPRARARLLSYWLYHNPSGWVLRRLLETQPEAWSALATNAYDCLDAVHQISARFLDELWNSAQVRASARGYSVNSILYKPCGDSDYTCLDGKLATHPEASYHLGQRQRKTVRFAQLYPFLVEKVGESPQASRDIIWLISFGVFVANLRGRLAKMLEKVGVAQV